jgi:hypothetical protein
VNLVARLLPFGRRKRLHRAIELHIGELAELFDSFDPCPFLERDLAAAAEEYIVESMRELHTPPTSMVFHIDRTTDAARDVEILETAIHRHFGRKTGLASRELRAMLRRGWISLAIGLAFLFALLGASESAHAGLFPSPLASVLRESLVIGGWVAMWRPLEVFLYDWWPVAGQRRMYAALARIPIRVRKKTASSSPAGTVEPDAMTTVKLGPASASHTEGTTP